MRCSEDKLYLAVWSLSSLLLTWYASLPILEACTYMILRQLIYMSCFINIFTMPQLVKPSTVLTSLACAQIWLFTIPNVERGGARHFGTGTIIFSNKNVNLENLVAKTTS